MICHAKAAYSMLNAQDRIRIKNTFCTQNASTNTAAPNKRSHKILKMCKASIFDYTHTIYGGGERTIEPYSILYLN